MGVWPAALFSLCFIVFSLFPLQYRYYFKHDGASDSRKFWDGRLTQAAEPHALPLPDLLPWRGVRPSVISTVFEGFARPMTVRMRQYGTIQIKQAFGDETQLNPVPVREQNKTIKRKPEVDTNTEEGRRLIDHSPVFSRKGISSVWASRSFEILFPVPKPGGAVCST